MDIILILAKMLGFFYFIIKSLCTMAMYKFSKACYNINVKTLEETTMKQMYVPKEKKSKNVISVKVDMIHLASPVHKYGALNNKSKVFDDRRKRKPKYKPCYSEEY